MDIKCHIEYTATDTTSANGELKIILYVIGVVAAVSGPSSAVIAGVIIIKWKQRQCAVKSKGKKVDIMYVSHVLYYVYYSNFPKIW